MNTDIPIADVMERLYWVKDQQSDFKCVCAVRDCIEAIEALANKVDPLERVRQLTRAHEAYQNLKD